MIKILSDYIYGAITLYGSAFQTHFNFSKEDPYMTKDLITPHLPTISSGNSVCPYAVFARRY